MAKTTRKGPRGGIATPALAALIERRGLSQAALADRADVDPSTISYLISGRRRCGYQVAQAIAEALEVKIEDLAQSAHPAN